MYKIHVQVTLTISTEFTMHMLLFSFFMGCSTSQKHRGIQAEKNTPEISKESREGKNQLLKLSILQYLNFQVYSAGKTPVIIDVEVIRI